MAINLSNLKISLDKFNEAAKGTYNIGQKKLGADCKSVYRTNNHKTWTIFNGTEIKPEEALAVKFAFCNALKKEKLSPEAIDDVKKKLGIPGDALDALKAGNIKPLTAAEVREVIDKYADQINQNRAAAAHGTKAVKILKTSNEFYRGVGRAEMAARATTRNAINAQSLGKIKTKTNVDKSVNCLLDILQFSESGGRITPAGKKLAQNMLVELSNTMALTKKMKSVDVLAVPIRFMLQDDGKIGAKIMLGSGNFFSVNTGLDKAGLIEKVTNVLNDTLSRAEPSAARPRAEKKSADDAIVKSIFDLEMGGEEHEMSNREVFAEIKAVFDELTMTHGVSARRKLRDTKMESVVTLLLKTLNKIRRLDNRNTELINNVREVFYGNKKVKPDAVLGEIADVLSKKPTRPKEENSDNEILGPIEAPDENININAFLGGD